MYSEMTDALKFLHHYFHARPRQWHPLLSVFYLTYACCFRCAYCSDGAGKPYYTLPENNLSPEAVLRIINAIRKNCNSIVITGGEPLQYPKFTEVVTQLKTFQFKETVLTTNGYYIEPYIDVIAENFSNLVISIDTMDEDKADRNYGQGKGVFKTILNNIDTASKRVNKKFSINISSVAAPGNIDDLYEVYKYASRSGFTFAVAPHLVGVKANKMLEANDDYFKFYDFLVREKRKGGKIFGSAKYLEYMRDLKKFNCHPFTMLVVSPSGEVFYPCLEMGNYAGNLLEENDLNKIKQRGEKLFGPQPDCDNRCHSACALSFGLLMQNPVSQLSGFF